MYRSGPNRIIPIILVIVVVVAFVIGLVTVGRYFFSGNNTGQSDEESAMVSAQEQLLTLETDRSVRVTLRGPIVADEKFQTYRITVSPSARTYTIYEGYLEKVDYQKTYDNNMQAYEEFVHALDKAAFTRPGKQTAEEAGDIRGICATGRVYTYEIVGPTGVIEEAWTSTCKGSPGTFGASVAQVTNLFTAQIPEETFRASSSFGRLTF